MQFNLVQPDQLVKGEIVFFDSEVIRVHSPVLAVTYDG